MASYLLHALHRPLAPTQAFTLPALLPTLPLSSPAGGESSDSPSAPLIKTVATLALVLTPPLIIHSRLRLRKHTLAQCLAGAALGLLLAPLAWAARDRLSDTALDALAALVR